MPVEAHHPNGHDAGRALDVIWLCRAHHREAHAAIAEPRRCGHCGVEFRPVTFHVDQLYCSGRCRVAAFRARRRDGAGSTTGTSTAGTSPAGDAPKGGPA